MVVATVPALVLVLGAVVWCLPVNPTIREMAKWGFIVGLFWVLAALSRATVHF